MKVNCGERGDEGERLPASTTQQLLLLQVESHINKSAMYKPTSLLSLNSKNCKNWPKTLLGTLGCYECSSKISSSEEEKHGRGSQTLLQITEKQVFGCFLSHRGEAALLSKPQSSASQSTFCLNQRNYFIY